MARIHTHYDNLKVARDAPPEVIRAAYRTLSKKYHPDHHPDNPESIRIIQLINSAYDVLSDPVRRQEHDRWIAREEAAQQAAERPAIRHPFRSARHDASPRRSAASGSSRGGSILQKARLTLGQLFKGFYRKA